MDQQPHSKEPLKGFFFLFFKVRTEQLFDLPSLHTFLINASAQLHGDFTGLDGPPPIETDFKHLQGLQISGMVEGQEMGF